MDQINGAPRELGSNRSARVAFNGQNKTFRHLVTLGAIWEIFTFGFYRFWLTTNMRRHLWTHTSAEGDALEYTGRGVELLIGFLIALAVIVPGYLLFFIISLEAERLKAFLSLPLFLLIYGFTQFAVYRARRYRLTRTVWRGARFWMSGSGIHYAFKAFGWQILTGVTLGLAYPWSVASLERYKINHTYYGDLPARFVGTGWTFFKRGFWLWCLAWVPVGLLIAVGVFARSSHPAETAAGGLNHLPLAVNVLLLFPILSLIILPFVYAGFKAIEWRWWIQSIRFGGIQLDSDLEKGALIGVYWKMIGMACVAILAGILFMMVVFGIGLGLIVALKVDMTGIVAQMKTGHLTWQLAPVAIFYLIAYLGLVQMLGIVRRIYLIQRIWKTVAASITIHHLELADAVVAKGELANAFGEGLADGLDLAGF